jgi:hypothetical protein
MSAVNETHSTLRSPLLVAGALSLALTACGGAPAHTGYADGEAEPWEKATKLRLRETGDATIEGGVNFAKRERAKWYVLELPAPGNMQAKLKMDPKSTGADVGFEILDEGFNVVAQPLDDNDIGQDDKLRNVQNVRKGKYYFHVFALQRTDVTDYKLRVRYDPLVPVATVQVTPEAPVDPRSVFPWTVPNLPALAQVPAADDSPRGRKVTEEPDEVKPVEPDDPWKNAPITGTISEFQRTSQGVRIVINRGSGGGVEEGMVGTVVDKSGRALPKGTFKVRNVKSDECEGVVGLTEDQVQANRRVKLKLPQ